MISSPRFPLVVTGIPATEARSLRSRGDCRCYREEASLFVPLPPTRKPAAS